MIYKMMTMTRFRLLVLVLHLSVGLEAGELGGWWGLEEDLQGCFGSQEDWQEHRDLHLPGGPRSLGKGDLPCPLTLLIPGLHWLSELHFLARDG